MPETRDLVRLLGTRFIQRRDVKAFQHKDGAWHPERTAFTMQDFTAHLEGSKTLGHYLVDLDGNCKLFAYDIDLVKHDRDCADQQCKGCPVTVTDDDGNPWAIPCREFWQTRQDHPAHQVLTRHLRCMAEGLAVRIHRTLQIPVAIATSGSKGLHVYGFTDSLPAEDVRQYATTILDDFGCFEAFRGTNFFRHTTDYRTLDIEVFPKQSSLEGKDLGNLMKLPLGIHQVTGVRSEFISCRTDYQTLAPMDPQRALDGDLPWE